ncbi:phage late control D family protein [bacterium D16-51]|nr:phage late control D family protein [bacterium D16-59]RKI62485.1 phage late control D family protein [bacterium D16-51]
MPDLMTGTYTFEALASKYGNFCVPLIRIRMNGTELVSALKLSVVDIKVTLSLHAAGMVLFKLGGLYDAKSHSFDKKIKSYFALGSIMEVELGYLSHTCKIFKGFVAMLGAEFSRAPFLVVTLMDARRLMMLSGSQYMLHEVVNYSDAFKTIIAKYSKLCSPEIDATDDSLERPLSQTQNDYLFVTKELVKNGKVDREFFVLGSKVYFRKPRRVKQPIMTLQYGRELLALKIDEEYQDLKVEVIGYDGQAQNVVAGSAAVKKNKNQKKLFSSAQVFTVADPAVNTQKKANEKASVIAKEKEWKARSGRGVTMGLPELVPGRFVKVEALEKDYGDHEYYIESVVHTIDNESFRTTFEIGGWE